MPLPLPLPLDPFRAKDEDIRSVNFLRILSSFPLSFLSILSLSGDSDDEFSVSPFPLSLSSSSHFVFASSDVSLSESSFFSVLMNLIFPLLSNGRRRFDCTTF